MQTKAQTQWHSRRCLGTALSDAMQRFGNADARCHNAGLAHLDALMRSALPTFTVPPITESPASLCTGAARNN